MKRPWPATDLGEGPSRQREQGMLRMVRAKEDFSALEELKELSVVKGGGEGGDLSQRDGWGMDLGLYGSS